MAISDEHRATVAFILDSQTPAGAIPWYPGGHLDPWDHVEAAMGLTCAGETAAALRAYHWLAEQQLPDGSFWSRYEGDGELVPLSERRETHFSAYLATGVYHYWRVTGDTAACAALLPAVRRALDFVVGLQQPDGDIHWALAADGTPLADALVTGCSSIYHSLGAGIALATALGEDASAWRAARMRLGLALRHKPERFDRTWASKSRYAMDWYYPVLTGVLPEADARARLAARWEEFVETGLGCRCVVEEPWVTVAESCELVLALLACGRENPARELFQWLSQYRSDCGAYWTGYQFHQDTVWPEEKTTWTAGVWLLAEDALAQRSRGWDLFQHSPLETAAERELRRAGS